MADYPVSISEGQADNDPTVAPQDTVTFTAVDQTYHLGNLIRIFGVTEQTVSMGASARLTVTGSAGRHNYVIMPSSILAPPVIIIND